MTSATAIPSAVGPSPSTLLAIPVIPSAVGSNSSHASSTVSSVPLPAWAVGLDNSHSSNMHSSKPSSPVSPQPLELDSDGDETVPETYNYIRSSESLTRESSAALQALTSNEHGGIQERSSLVGRQLRHMSLSNLATANDVAAAADDVVAADNDVMRIRNTDSSFAEASNEMRAMPTARTHSSRNARHDLLTLPERLESTNLALIRRRISSQLPIVQRVLNVSTPRQDLLHELQQSRLAINLLLLQDLLQRPQIARQPLIYSNGGNPPEFNLPPPPLRLNPEVIRGLEPDMAIPLQHRSSTCWKVIRIALVVLAVFAAAFLLTTGIGYLATGAFTWALISIGVSSKAIAATYVIAGGILGTLVTTYVIVDAWANRRRVRIYS